MAPAELDRGDATGVVITRRRWIAASKIWVHRYAPVINSSFGPRCRCFGTFTRR